MNDELKTKLINIIEAVERGMPGIADRILSEFLAFHTVCAVATSVFAVLLTVGCVLSGWWYTRDTWNNDGYLLLASIFGVAAPIVWIFAVYEIAVVQAPVYHLLRELR